MGLLSRGPRQPATADDSLPDGEWLEASRQIYKGRIDRFYGSPETMAAGGKEHYGHGDFGTAMFFFAKSIDMLHTAYGFNVHVGSRRHQHVRPARAH